MSEFFNPPSSPKGHGFSRANIENHSACYTFEPMKNLPVKVIVLDDTCKLTGPSGGPMFYGGGWMDTAPVIPGLFNIVRSENRGMAFGILNDSTSDWPTTLLIVESFRMPN